MFATNPFSILAETVPSIVMQGFIIVNGFINCSWNTLLDIIHQKM